MQTKFFGRNAFGGVFCALFAGLVFVIANCGGDGGSSGDGDSSSSGTAPPMSDITSAEININDISFDWYGTQEQYVNINASFTLTSTDPEITGFDSVLIKLGGKTINNDGKGTGLRTYQYKNDGADRINVEEMLGLGICGTRIDLVVEVYAFKNTGVSTQRTVSLNKSSDTGNCRSSASVQSSSSVTVVKPLVRIIFSNGDSLFTIKNGEGVNFATGGSGTDITLNWADRTFTAGGSISSLISEFVRGENCGTRATTQPKDDTSIYLPCPTADSQTEVQCANNTTYLGRTAAAPQDWGPGWYLISCSPDISVSGAIIRAWKVN